MTSVPAPGSDAHPEVAPPAPGHVPVLLREVVALLSPQPGETVVDCTAGLGGHAAALAPCVGPTGRIVLNDLDPTNLARAGAVVRSAPDAPSVTTVRGNFAELPRRLVELGLAADAVLLDLGFASSQMDDASRGFSFMRDGPLDMRLDPDAPVTAARLVNTLPEGELAEILRDFGEERQARRIASKLVAERALAPIETTGRLAKVVSDALGGSGRAHSRPSGPSPGGPPGGPPGRPSGRIHPATRTFQALRIAVNDELGALRSLLESVTRVASGPGIAPGGSWLARSGRGVRIVVISFHSLEDRLVKHAFAELVHRGLGEHLAKHPVAPSPDEQRLNPRSRSAKLRAVRLTS